MTKPELLTELSNRVRSNGVGGLTTAYDLRVFLAAFVNSIFEVTDGITTTVGNNYSKTVKITGDQLIAGIKSFSSFPISAGTPTEDTQLVNKLYVDDLVAAMIDTIASSIPFDASAPIKRQLPGLEGESWTNGSIVDAMNNFLYGVKYPTPELLNIPQREIGSTSINVQWSVTKTDASISYIAINGSPITPTGDTQTGTTSVPVSDVSDTTMPYRDWETKQTTK